MKRYILFLIALPLIAACSHPEYDISEGFNKEITLFGDEISAPLGSIGPLTIGSTLNGLSQIPDLGGLVSQYIKEAEDGSLVMDDAGSIFQINVYELEKRLADPSTPQTWTTGYQSGFMGGMVSMLGFIGLKAANQKVVITAKNPLYSEVPAKAAASYNCMGSDGYFTGQIDGLGEFKMKRGTSDIATFSVPDNVTAPLSSITLSSLSLDLPGDPVSYVSDKNGNLIFELGYKYTGGIAIGDSFSFPLTNFSPSNVKVEIGKYKLSKCEVTVELESTVPLQVEISNIRVLKHKDSESDPDVVDENILVGPGITVAGGSLEKPAVTPINLTVEALEGTIPDIEGLLLDLKVSAQPGLGTVPLSAKQGVFVKSSSARLSGGITIPQE